ncbi:MAG: AI-2E family transporter, partial [Rhodoglobus sp.]|nr:AI-2E family transporter [Rhodoglobus sp.]
MALRRQKAVPAVDAEETVPPALKIAAAYSWRILLVVGVLAVLVFAVIQFRDIVVPLFVAVLLGALLVPLVNWLMSHRWPKWLAIVVPLVATLSFVTGLVVLVVLQVRAGYPDLQAQSVAAYDRFTTWLVTSPF